MTARAVPVFRRRWTAAQIRALGTRTDIPTAGSILAGMSPTQSYALAAAGRFPVPVLTVGRRKVVPTAPILALLGIDDGGVQIRLPVHGQGQQSAGEHGLQLVPDGRASDAGHASAARHA